MCTTKCEIIKSQFGIMEMEDVRILALRAAGALFKSARRILYPFSHDCICKGDGMKERREPPCPPLKLHSSAGLKWRVSVCLREESIYLPCTYITSTSWSSLRSLICLPTNHYSAPPTLHLRSYSPIIVCPSLHLFWLFMAE